MNQQQLKYARERLSELYNTKAQDVRDHFYSNRVKLSSQQKVDLVLAGSFKIVEPVKRSWAPAFEDFFEFEGQNDFYKEELDALAVLKQEKQAVMDELMLGDNEKALEAIQAFAKLKVI